MFLENDYDKNRLPYLLVNTNDFEAWPHKMIFCNGKMSLIKRDRFIIDEKYKKAETIKNKIIKFNFADDPKRIIPRLTMLSSSMSSFLLMMSRSFRMIDGTNVLIFILNKSIILNP
jgi:hypothetical protein